MPRRRTAGCCCSTAESLNGWKNNNDKPVRAKIEDGAINPYGSGGYLLVYEKPFGDFVLKCDVKMSQPDCNSGVFVRTGDLNDPVYSGLEVQVSSEHRARTATISARSTTWWRRRRMPRTARASGTRSKSAAKDRT